MLWAGLIRQYSIYSQSSGIVFKTEVNLIFVSRFLAGMKIRLRGSHQPNMGRIEVYYAGRWGAIYPWFGTPSMKKKASTVMCRQLGYRGASLSGYNMFCSEAVLPWFTNLRCDGSEISLNQCDFDFYFNTSVDCMNVLCTNEMTDSGKDQ